MNKEETVETTNPIFYSEEGLSPARSPTRPTKAVVLKGVKSLFCSVKLEGFQQCLKLKLSSAQTAWAVVIKGNKQQDNQDLSESSMTRSALKALKTQPEATEEQEPTESNLSEE